MPETGFYLCFLRHGCSTQNTPLLLRHVARATWRRSGASYTMLIGACVCRTLPSRPAARPHSPAILVVGFHGVGIALEGTGAGYIHNCWLGQYEAGDPTPRKNATATAIMLAGAEHDCDVNNVIIFSGKVGVNSSNGT